MRLEERNDKYCVMRSETTSIGRVLTIKCFKLTRRFAPRLASLAKIRTQSESSSRSPNPPQVSSSSSNDMDLSSAAFQSPSEPPNREDLKKGGIEMKKTEGGENAESRSPSFTFSEPQSTPGNQEVSSQQINVINKLLCEELRGAKWGAGMF